MSFELLALALLGGLLRIGPPLICAAVGDCLTQRAGRFNLGLEGVVPCTAVLAALGGQHGAGIGVLAAVAGGAALAGLHALCCSLPRSNEIAVGIAFLVGGTALARFVGDGQLAVAHPSLPQIDLVVEAAGRSHVLGLSWLLLAALAAAVLIHWGLRATGAGLLLRAAGQPGGAAALAASGRSQTLLQLAATSAGGAFAGLAGAHLALFHPGGWSDGLGAGVGIGAVTIVFIARARPLVAVLLAAGFAAIVAFGLALQVALGTGGYHLFSVLPFILALLVMGTARRRPGRA
ncbi:MAG: ABC transporter permease [Betaproteobacteria bacterium AqS2]|uniref:ABC transporter permease n=1 Tax=Candidatus Amphirhobacter heronislandensis TaxID=1732024 RepID=A0A930UI88_9GAMM|nr:ABC transporter permease [Betaproteobacteria bacterium AqS2]